MSQVVAVTQLRQGFSTTRPLDKHYDPVYATSKGRAAAAHAATIRSMPAPEAATTTHNASQPSAAPMHKPAPPMAAAIEADSRVIRGPHRFKFHTRPVMPYMNAIPAEVLLSPEAIAAATEAEARLAGAIDPAAAAPEAAEPVSKSVGVQTVYRESQTQTDPYTPDYITAPGQADPEVLSIAHLKWGAGLPAGLEEVQLIQKLREKRAFEASLPTGTDEASLKLRKKLLEERELQEWATREEEMREEQEARLRVLIDTLQAREEKAALLSEARVDAVRADAVRKRDAALEAIHRERLKAQRALDHGRAAADSKEENKRARDIITEASDFASRIYAPATRDGKVPVRNQVVDYGIPLINNYQGLVALEGTLHTAALKAAPQEVAAPTAVDLAPKDRGAQKAVADLDYLDSVLSGTRPAARGPAFGNKYRRFEPVVRPAPQTVAAPADEQVAQAVLLLQRLLRGRAVQEAMRASRARTQPLIRELRLLERTAGEAARLQDETEAAERETKELEAAVDAVQGHVLSEALDFLTKEVVRIAEEQKVVKFAVAAREARREREAVEGGRRQAEYVLRKKKEHLLEEVVKVHQEAAGRLTDLLLAGAVEQMADAAAVAAVATAMPAAKAAAVSAAVAAAQEHQQGAEEEEEEEEDSAAVVRDLLVNFVMPEVARKRVAGEQATVERRHLAGAHAAALSVLSDLSKAAGVLPGPRVSAPVPLPEHTAEAAEQPAAARPQT